MQTIYLDISNKGAIPCIQAKQSEVGRKFLVVITDNGVPYNISNDSLLSVWYEGDTDAGNYSSIEEKSAFTIDGNKVSVELVAQMLLKPGKGELCLSISHGDGGETNTWNIPYEVEYKPGAGSEVPSEYYTALTDSAARAAEQVGLARDEADRAQTQAAIAKDAANLATHFMQILAPVGYVFIWDAVADANIDLSTAEKVATHFGFGTWEQITDTFLMAAGEKYQAGTIGGQEQHTLTIEEMPQHTHKVFYESTGGSENTWGFSFTSNGGVASPYNTPANTGVLYSGGSEPFDIVPKYKSVYVWKRIA